MKNKQNLTIVMFGATGDLAKKKLWSSFEALVKKEKIAKPNIIGVAYSDRTQDKFKEILHEASSGDWYKSATYLSGDLDKDEIYHEIADNLEGKLNTTVMFVLAVAPEYFMDVAIGLDKSDLADKCRQAGHKIRILIEKPFGTDLESAKKLDEEFCSRFESNEIYRIDHYLGKSMLQNLYTLRAANPWFSAGLSRETVESIQVTFLENNDASDRGAFYDSTGAWRDVGQNHLLQLLAAAMSPIDLDHSGQLTNLADNRTKLLSSLELVKHEEFVKGQYQTYRETNKVGSDSNTETYFKVHLKSNLSNWHEIPITLESGKSTGLNQVSVSYHLQSPLSKQQATKLEFSSKPTESATIELWGQDDSHGHDIEKHTFEFSYSTPTVDAYERVFLSAINGDNKWFVSSTEVRAAWQLADQVHKALQKTGLQIYPDDTLLE